MSEGRIRLVVGAVVPALIVGLAIVPWGLTWGDLPDPLATRFGAGGASSSSSPLWVQLALLGVVCGGAAVVLVRIARRPGPDAGIQASVASFVGLLVSVLGLLTALANRGHDDWRDVRLGFPAVGVAMCLTIATAVVVARVAQRVAPPRPVDPVVEAGLPLGPTDRAVWFGRTRSRAFLVAGAAFVVVGVVVALRSQLYAGASTILVGGVLMAFASVGITVSDRGLHVRSGPFPWLRVRFPLGVVTSARAIDLRPTSWGGWGYRGSVRLVGRAAWVLRAGPALELELVGGQRFAVTVDDADEAAAVLNGLLARSTD